jgi:hypothetical protein
MGTKRLMSSSLSNLVECRNSHRPFTLSCAIIDPSSTPSPMQIMNHPLVPPPIVINFALPISSLYWPLALRVNVGLAPFQTPLILHN